MAVKRPPKFDPSKPLAHTRWERFCRFVAEGADHSGAYEKAGFKRSDANAARLLRRPEVRARIEWFKKTAAAKLPDTVNSIAEELNQARDLAQENKQPGAMVQAIMGKAKVLGLVVDRHRVASKSLDDMTEAELIAFLGEGAADGD